MIHTIDVSKIDENRCKQTLANLPFLGLQVVSVIMNLPQNTAYARGSKYVIFTCL